MKFRLDKKYIYWGVTILLVALTVVFFGLLLFYVMFHGMNFQARLRHFLSIITPILNGFIIAYVFTPILNFIERTAFKYLFRVPGRSSLKESQRKRLRGCSILLTLALVALLMTGFFSVVVPQVIMSVQSIFILFPYYLKNLQDLIDNLIRNHAEIADLFGNIEPKLETNITNFVNETLVPNFNELLRTVSSYAFNVVKAVWNLLIGLIISIYLMANKERYAGQAKKIAYSILSVKKANNLITDCRFAHRTFCGFLSGKVLDSLIIGLICFLGTTFIGTPYPILISLIVGVTNIIPFFGPYIGAIPSLLLILMISPIQALYFLIFVFALQQFDGNFLGPKILGNSTGLSSFWVIFAITIFGGFFGIFGMIIGVPTFAVIYAFIKRQVNRGLKKKKLTTESSEYEYLNNINVETGEYVPLTSDEIVEQQHTMRHHTEAHLADDADGGISVTLEDSNSAQPVQPSVPLQTTVEQPVKTDEPVESVEPVVEEPEENQKVEE